MLMGIKMRKLLLLFCTSAVLAQTGAPRYEVHRASGRVVVDGEIGTQEWAAASPAVEFQFPWDSQTGAKQKTRARLLWDDEYLYVAYECDDADIYAQFTERDDPVYRDDTVEIFLNVKPSQIAAYYGFEVNARGAYNDYICTEAQHYLKRFQMEGLKMSSHIDGTLNMRGDKDRGWSMEVAIPWKNFDSMAPPPKVGTVYTANLNRWDGVEPNRRLSVWSDSKLDWPHPHAPEHFGELVFVE
jgi:hypothetical protein